MPRAMATTNTTAETTIEILRPRGVSVVAENRSRSSAARRSSGWRRSTSALPAHSRLNGSAYTKGPATTADGSSTRTWKWAPQLGSGASTPWSAAGSKPKRA